MQLRRILLAIGTTGSLVCVARLIPFVFAESQAAREWGLFNQILMIGIGVGIVVFGLLFYAVIRYREKPQKVQVDGL